MNKLLTAVATVALFATFGGVDISDAAMKNLRECNLHRKEGTFTKGSCKDNHLHSSVTKDYGLNAPGKPDNNDPDGPGTNPGDNNNGGDDDHDNGHGNDDDHNDDSNPGNDDHNNNGGGHPNNGHGNDPDGNDNSNPGHSNDPNDNTDADGSPGHSGDSHGNGGGKGKNK